MHEKIDGHSKLLLGTGSSRSLCSALHILKMATESCGSTKFGIAEEAVEMAVGALWSAYACKSHLEYIVQVRALPKT
jgi:hypothetical protein